MSFVKTIGRQWLWGVAAALVLGAGGGFMLARHLYDAPPPQSEGRKILYWHDPMVPNVKFDKPGKSPFMDMELVPVYADEAAGTKPGVQVPANVTQSLGIRIGKVERAVAQTRLSAVADVVFDDRLLAVVPARVDGYVTRLAVHAPLERVRRGQVLAEVQAPQWLEAQQEYLALLDASSESARSLRDAARARLRVLGIPEEAIRAIETERRTSGTTVITSPIDGVVTELGVREGTAFSPGMPLFRINGLRTIWANARIPEAQVAQLPVGSQATARATAWPGASFAGKVIALLPQVDPTTRTMIARVEIDNAGGKLAPGMFLNLEFAATTAAAQLFVPSEAVIATGERTVVITRNDDGSFGVANVTTGVEQDGKTAILSGLSEGQAIVLSGQFLIDSEASLRSAITRLEDAP